MIATPAHGYGAQMTDSRSLSAYLNDHLAGATGGVELFHRAARSHQGEAAEELGRLRDEVVADRASLRSLMGRLEVRENLPMAAIGWVGEKVGRLKPHSCNRYWMVRRLIPSTEAALDGEPPQASSVRKIA